MGNKKRSGSGRDGMILDAFWGHSHGCVIVHLVLETGISNSSSAYQHTYEHGIPQTNLTLNTAGAMEIFQMLDTSREGMNK